MEHDQVKYSLHFKLTIEFGRTCEEGPLACRAWLAAYCGITIGSLRNGIWVFRVFCPVFNKAVVDAC